MVSPIRLARSLEAEKKNKRLIRLPPDPKNKVKKISKKFTGYTKTTTVALKDKKEKPSTFKKKAIKQSKNPSRLQGIFQKFLSKFVKKKPPIPKGDRKRFLKYKA